MIGLFIGAGFSKWSMNLPLVHELFDFEISNIRSNDEIWYNKLKQIKNIWDLSNPNSANEKFILSLLKDKKMRPKKYLSKYLSRRLSEPFLCNIYGQSIQTYMLNDKKINDLVGISKARKFITSFGINNIKGIITTNYDLIIEYALGTKRFNYGKKDAHIKGRGHNPLFPWQNTPVILNGRLVLSKLHGSISYDGVDYWSSGICGLNGKAIIIPPYPEKHNHNEFSKEWKCARQTLESIDKLVIFGFNFNDYDIAILELLKTNSKKIKKIIIYDIESKMEKASKIWDPNKITELNINTIDDSISFLKSHTQTKLI